MLKHYDIVQAAQSLERVRLEPRLQKPGYEALGMALAGLCFYPDAGDSWRCLGLAPADGAVVDDMMVQQRLGFAEFALVI